MLGQLQKEKPLVFVDNMPLRSMMGVREFAKWGINIWGPIKPSTRSSHAKYLIIVTDDYLTKWVEAKATPKNDAQTMAKFLYEYVLTRYGLPIEIVSDEGAHFAYEVIKFLLVEFMVVHRRSAPYHHQAKSTNKTLCTVFAGAANEKASKGTADIEVTKKPTTNPTTQFLYTPPICK